MKLFGLLLAVFVVLPALEFAVLIEVGRRLGTGQTLLLIFGTSLVGIYLARMEGFRILYRIRNDLRAGVQPAEHVLDGVLVFIAGVALIVPGLLTDIAGLVLLFPFTRHLIRAFVRRRARRWIEAGHVRVIS